MSIEHMSLLDGYVRLEAGVRAAESAGDEAAAEILREQMDSLWLQLSDDQREELNRRTEPPTFRWQHAPVAHCPDSDWQPIAHLPPPDGRATIAICSVCTAKTVFDVQAQVWGPWITLEEFSVAHPELTDATEAARAFLAT